MDDINVAVADGKVVCVHYTLTNDDGVVLDSSRGHEPQTYLHGAGNIVPGLERQMLGHRPGDEFDAVVPPEEAYGLREQPGVQIVPRSAFPHDIDVQAGMQFVVQAPDGSEVPLWVTETRGDQVLVDFNHPLAGETLHFAIRIVSVRDATEEEVQHGHPHGPGSH